MMSLPRLRAEDKILLHLYEWINAVDEYERPEALTQQGIASSTGIKRGYVAIVLARMIERGIVEVSLSRVRGKARSRKTYCLTPSGYAQALRLLDSLGDLTVTVNGVDIPFRHAIQSGLSPVHVIRLSEFSEERSSPSPPTSPSPTRSGTPQTLHEQKGGYDSLFEPSHTGPYQQTTVYPVPPAHSLPHPQGATAYWCQPVLHSSPLSSSLRRGLAITTFLAGTSMLVLSLLLLHGPVTGIGNAITPYLLGLTLVSISFYLANLSGILALIRLIPPLVLVHLSYMIRGISHHDALLIPAIALSLLAFHRLVPATRWRDRMISATGSVFILLGFTSFIPGIQPHTGLPEAWIIMGASAVLMSSGGWNPGVQQIRGIYLGTGIYAIFLVPLHPSLHSSPGIPVLTTILALSGLMLIWLSLSRRPVRRIGQTSVVLSTGGMVMVLSLLLHSHDLEIAGLMELLLALALLYSGIRRSGLRKVTDLLTSSILASIPPVCLLWILSPIIW